MSIQTNLNWGSFLSILTVLAAGCAPGEIVWASGDSPLRTAMYVEREVEGVPSATLLLSNGQFTCDLPSFEDPAEQSQALLDILVAACRESARHVRIDLYRSPTTSGWQGRYSGRDEVVPSQISEGRPRLATAAYYGILEAELIAVDGFERVYAATESERYEQAAVDGEVLIETSNNDRMHGTFGLPIADISGEFRAERCPDATALLDLLAVDPLLTCP